MAQELKREGYGARTIVLKMRYSDFTTITRQTTLRTPTADETEIRAIVQQLLEQHRDPQRAVRLIGVGAHNLVAEDATRQLELL